MRKIVAIVSLVSCGVMAATDNIGIGFSGSWERSPYLGERPQFSPIPLIDYDSRYLFISGTSGGLHLWQQTNQQLDLAVEYQSLTLKSATSDDRRIQQLDRRNPTLLVGLAYSQLTPYGQFSVEALIDTLNNSQGITIDLGYAGYLALTEQWAVIPQFGVIGYNRNYNRYYYGVNQHEAQRSGFAIYQPKRSLSPYLTLTSTYALTANWLAVVEYDYCLLGHTVSQSPIVDHTSLTTVSAGIIYYF